jgi:hypothetical protein
MKVSTTEFKQIPTVPSSNPTTDNQVSRKAYADTKLPVSINSSPSDASFEGIKTTLTCAETIVQCKPIFDFKNKQSVSFFN